MGRRKYLRSNQTAVLDDLFSGEFDEQAVLDKHKVTRNTYNKWLADKRFAEEFSRRIACAYRQSEALIARYSAVKLVQLTESDKPETARRACLDIISLPRQEAQKISVLVKAESSAGKQTRQLSPEVASRLLAALAESKKTAAAGDRGA
jgi:hypothetical protein